MRAGRSLGKTRLDEGDGVRARAGQRLAEQAHLLARQLAEPRKKELEILGFHRAVSHRCDEPQMGRASRFANRAFRNI